MTNQKQAPRKGGAPQKNINARKGDTNLKRYTIRLYPAQVESLKAIAARQGVPGGYNGLVQQIVTAYITQQSNKPNAAEAEAGPQSAQGTVTSGNQNRPG